MRREGKVEGGDRYRKIKEQSVREETKSYKAKWESSIEQKVEYLTKKFCVKEDNGEDELLSGIHWSDHDIGDLHLLEENANLVLIGEISPPLTEMELKVLNEDPSFCLEEKVTREMLAISLEEGKIKRVWTEMNRYPVGEDEEPPSEEDLARIKEVEDEARRIYDYDAVAMDYGNQKATDTP